MYRFDLDDFDPLILIDVDDCCFTDEEKDILREKLRQKFKEDNPHLFQDVDPRPTNQIFPSLPMTEESATAIAEKIQEAAKKGN